jgi:predicted dehydrogenase
MPLSRRTFLKSSAAAAITVPALSTYARTPFTQTPASTLQPAAHTTGSDTIRIGLIGAGGRGTGATIEALRADPGSVLVSIGDIFPDRAASALANIREELKADAATKVRVTPESTFIGLDAYQKVIASGVDLVILTGYPGFRPEHLRAAIDAGKHVFAEKPLAVDSPGLRSVYQSAAKAKQKNLALMVGLCWRHNSGMQASFDKINSGAIGEIVSVHTTYHTSTLSRHPRQPNWSDLEFQLRNWWHFNWLSGDHIVEQAIHSIDRGSWAMGDKLPVKCECLGGRAARSGPEHGNVFDHFFATYEYANGVRAFHSCRQIDGCPSDNTDYIQGTKGSAVVEGWRPIYRLKDRAGKDLWKHSGEILDMYQSEHNALFASLRAGTPINDGERGANSTMLALMARQAAYTGQTITWEKAMAATESITPPNLSFTTDLPFAPVPIPGKTKST